MWGKSRWDFLGTALIVRGTDVQPRKAPWTKEEDLLLLFLDAQSSQEPRLGSQKGVGAKPGDGVEETKVTVQLHIAASPGGSCTLGRVTWPLWASFSPL